MKVSEMSEEQKKQRLEELNKINKKRALTQKEASEATQIENNWTDKELEDFNKLAKSMLAAPRM